MLLTEASSPAPLDSERQEQQRLQALQRYHILDTDPEVAFDRTVALAARLFRVPIALISLVDVQRQWFKACYGFDERQTDRSLSFCIHAVVANELLVVPDATLDARFQDNALVTGHHHIRFYAGAPLRTSDGQVLGTLCLLDTEPRARLTPDEGATLQDLADSVVSELEIRHSLQERTRSEALMSSVVQSSLDAIIVINATGEILDWNPAAELTFGWMKTEVIGRLYRDLVIPEALRLVHQTELQRYLNEGSMAMMGRRIEVVGLHHDGTEFPCEVVASPILLATETLFTMYIRDLRPQKQAEDALITSNNLLQAMVEGVPEALFVKDLNLRYVMINGAGADHLGRSQAKILGLTDHEIFPVVSAEQTTRRDREVLNSGEAQKYEVEDLLPTGRRRVFQSTKSVYRNAQGQIAGLIGLAIDMTEEKALALQIQEQNVTLETRVRERTQQLEESKLEMLNRLARAAEYRDDDTGQHVVRVATMVGRLAQVLGLTVEQIELMERAAPLHDLGKVGIPDRILLKPGRLDAEEVLEMRRHTEIGASILANGRSAVMRMAEEIARTHHERWDGTGYPRGLSGHAIPISGRIVAVADVLDALTSERPYKQAWSTQEALREIREQSGRQFDPAVVNALTQVLE